ncbi:MAG: hypothetical protein WC551_05975 [Patescibacteria group bacterium]
MSRMNGDESMTKMAIESWALFEEILWKSADFELLRGEFRQQLEIFRLELGRWRVFRKDLLANTQVRVLDCRHRDEDDWRDSENWIEGFDPAKHASRVHLFQFWNAQPRPAIFTEHFSGPGNTGHPVLLLGTRRFKSREAMAHAVMVGGDFERPEGPEQRWGTVSCRDGAWNLMTFIPTGEKEGIRDRIFNQCMEKLLTDACAAEKTAQSTKRRKPCGTTTRNC